MSSIIAIRENLIQTIIRAERKSANEIMLAWARQNSFKAVFTDLFEPVLKVIGDMWHENKLSLAQGYLAGKIAEDIFKEAIKDDEFKYSMSMNKGSVVIGNIEDDFHSLGRKLLGIFLRSAGWHVHDLGNDVLAEEFIEKALSTESRVVGVSAMMFTTAKNICRVRNLIDKQSLNGRIQLAVGGAIFKLRPELVKKFGGDGTAENALCAPQLFDKLWQKSLSYEHV